jgi:phosphinothricin acetyltransferase
VPRDPGSVREVDYVIRPAAVADAEQIRAIYAPFVENTAVSFEVEVPPVEAYTDALSRGGYPWLVADRDGEVLGYAKGSPFKDRAAYQWSVEIAVYIGPSARRSGVGTALVTALMDELRERGFVGVFAGTTLPNPGSIALFESLGFRHCGTYEKVGFKLGAWHDVGWWQRSLVDPHPPDPPPPSMPSGT